MEVNQAFCYVCFSLHKLLFYYFSTAIELSQVKELEVLGVKTCAFVCGVLVMLWDRDGRSAQNWEILSSGFVIWIHIRRSNRQLPELTPES